MFLNFGRMLSEEVVVLSDKGGERMTDEKSIDHEARERISKLEGIIEEIRTRLSAVATELREVRRELNALGRTVAWIRAGVVIALGLLVKIAFFT